MLVSDGVNSFWRGQMAAKIIKNCDFADIHFNYCGEDIWISIPVEDLQKFISNGDRPETTVTYDFPLNAETLMNKIRKLKTFNEWSI